MSEALEAEASGIGALKVPGAEEHAEDGTGVSPALGSQDRFPNSAASSLPSPDDAGQEMEEDEPMLGSSRDHGPSRSKVPKFCGDCPRLKLRGK